MTENITRYDADALGALIRTIRGQKAILDSDLDRVYGVTTKRLNEQVRRNPDRFPPDFAFVLSREETVRLQSNSAAVEAQPLQNQPDRMNCSQFVASSSRHRGTAYHPIAFTEHGAIMAANVLRSRRAVQMSVFVVRAFAKMREQLRSRSEMEKRLLQIENILLAHDDSIRDLYEKLRPLLLPPPEPDKKPIGFQVRERRARYGRKPR